MKIKMYSLSTCKHCKDAKAFFKKHNIEFENIEVDNNKKAIEEMYKKSKQYGVPVIEIKRAHGIGIVVGFDEGTLKQMLGINK